MKGTDGHENGVEEKYGVVRGGGGGGDVDYDVAEEDDRWN